MVRHTIDGFPGVPRCAARPRSAGRRVEAARAAIAQHELESTQAERDATATAIVVYYYLLHAQLTDALAENQPFEFVAVAIDDDWANVRDFFRSAVHRTAVRPDRADVHRQFGASTPPDTYLIDASGQVVARYPGARDWRTEAARKELTRSIAAARER